MDKMRTHKLALLASGSGSNVENLLTYFSGIKQVEIVLVASNKINCGALDYAKDFKVQTALFNKDFICDDEQTFLEVLQNKDIGIINIHPSLLPKFGGKGMYGKHVHQAVYDAKAKETGITIHLVNKDYDKGKIIFQASMPLNDKDSPWDIEHMVRILEQKHFPEVVHKYLEHEL